MKIEIMGEDITLPTDQAPRLFQDFGMPDLQVAPPLEDGPIRADPFTIAIGIRSIILMLLAAIDAMINLVDRAKRDTARQDVDRLKAVLADARAECIIITSGGRVLVLPKAATDEVVAAVLADLSNPPRI